LGQNEGNRKDKKTERLRSTGRRGRISRQDAPGHGPVAPPPYYMIRDTIVQLIREAAHDGVAADLTVPEFEKLGHYATNVALRLAKTRGVAPMTLAEEIAAAVQKNAPAGFFENVAAAAPGFVTFESNDTKRVRSYCAR